jgi:hypothetical protein
VCVWGGGGCICSIFWKTSFSNFLPFSCLDLTVLRIELCLSEHTGNDISLVLKVRTKDKDHLINEMASYVFCRNILEVFLPKNVSTRGTWLSLIHATTESDLVISVINMIL